jgi:four helix bundle protein
VKQIWKELKESRTQELKTQKVENKRQRLEDRLPILLRSVVRLCKKYQTELIAKRIIPQLVASIGSIGANYQEATAAMSKKDFIKCLKIARKEARESIIWLQGLDELSDSTDKQIPEIIQEVKEVSYILTSIISKSES